MSGDHTFFSVCGTCLVLSAWWERSILFQISRYSFRFLLGVIILAEVSFVVVSHLLMPLV